MEDRSLGGTAERLEITDFEICNMVSGVARDIGKISSWEGFKAEPRRTPTFRLEIQREVNS